MRLSVELYLILIALVAVLRLVELRHSRNNQRRMAQNGSARAPEPGYIWMVAFQTVMIAGSAAEVVFLDRPLIPWLAATSLILFLAANAVRWWAITTLGTRWNVNVMSVSKFGVVVRGPYKWVRHPNYTALFVEMLALPLIHSAWIVAIAGTLVHVLVLRQRVTLEESVMMRDPAYRATFAGKPRFLPTGP
jgi:methyltransferase